MTPRTLIEPARHAGAALLRSQSDDRLVDLTRAGNDNAFEAIVHRYRRPLLRYCAGLLPLNRAEDAVQQTFVSAHRAIVDGDAELMLKPWLYRIAHNAALNMLRQNGWDHDQVSEEIDGVETPPQAFERGERLRTVVAAVRELPDRQRDALVLRALEGRSYDEIATELGVSGGAVRQLLNRARTTLRDGATAITPWGLVTRLGGGDGGELAERVATAMAGAGGGAMVVKAGATLLVVGAVAGGATGALPSGGAGAQRDRGADAAARASLAGGGSGTRLASAGPGDAAGSGGSDTSGPARRGADRGPGSSGHGGRRGGEGRGSASFVDDRSGRGDDGGSGSGSGSGEGSSGHGGDDGSGDDHGGSSGGDDHSGSGGGSSGSDDGVDDHSGSGGSGGGSGSDGGDDSAALLADPATGTDSGSGTSGRSGSGGGDDGVTTDDHSGPGH